MDLDYLLDPFIPKQDLILRWKSYLQSIGKESNHKEMEALAKSISTDHNVPPTAISSLFNSRKYIRNINDDTSDGNKWTSFKPELKVDKSQDCYKEKIIKFDYGTKGSKISYYKIVLSKNVTKSSVMAVYKSGSKTGCGVFEACGFGCPKDK